MALAQAEEAETLRRDRDEKRSSLSALQEEVELHREQVCFLASALLLAIPMLPGTTASCCSNA